MEERLLLSGTPDLCHPHYIELELEREPEAELASVEASFGLKLEHLVCLCGCQ